MAGNLDSMLLGGSNSSSDSVSDSGDTISQQRGVGVGAQLRRRFARAPPQQQQHAQPWRNPNPLLVAQTIFPSPLVSSHMIPSTSSQPSQQQPTPWLIGWSSSHSDFDSGDDVSQQRGGGMVPPVAQQRAVAAAAAGQQQLPGAPPQQQWQAQPLQQQATATAAQQAQMDAQGWPGQDPGQTAVVPANRSDSDEEEEDFSEEEEEEEEDQLDDEIKKLLIEIEADPCDMVDAAPPGFICPLSAGIMREPVLTIVGSTFEKVMIKKWLKTKEIDPLTNEKLRDCRLIENRALRDSIEHWRITYTQNLQQKKEEEDSKPLAKPSLPRCEEAEDKEVAVFPPATESGPSVASSAAAGGLPVILDHLVEGGHSQHNQQVTLERYVNAVKEHQKQREVIKWMSEHDYSDSDKNASEDDDSSFDQDSSLDGGRIIVVGAGVHAVNGVYTRDGSLDNVKKYSNAGLWEDEEVIFSLFRCKLSDGTRRWYISIVPKGIQPGTNKDIDFYSAPIENELSETPPENRWTTAEGEGMDPAPMVYWKPNHVADTEDQEDGGGQIVGGDTTFFFSVGRLCAGRRFRLSKKKIFRPVLFRN